MVDAELEQPTTTPETPAAAPATSAPSQPTRPTSFEQAYEQVDAANAAKTPDATAPAAIAPAGTLPAGTPGEVVQLEAKGPIPFDVHHTALANARTKAIEARDQQWQEKAGWVLALPQNQQEAAPQLVRDFYTNPAMFIANVYSTLANHPQWGPQLRAFIGQGNGNGHAPVSDEPQPDVEIIVNPQTGQTVRSYSADQQAKREAWLSKQYDQRFEQRLAPFEEARRAEKDRADRAEFDRQATASVNQSTARILKILDERTDLVGHVNTLIDSGMHWLDAAIQVREQHLKPQQAQQATATAADTMRRKAAGNTANGSGAPVTPMARPKTEKELAAYMEQLDRG